MKGVGMSGESHPEGVRGEPLGDGPLWQDRVHMGRIYQETELGA